MKKNIFSAGFVSSLIIFLVLGIFFAWHHEIYKYGINTGTISFFTTAQKYIQGDFSNAVVGGFGPLPSWLLIPFLKLGLAPKFALCVVNFIIGLLILIGIRALSYQFEITENMRSLMSFTAVPIVLNFALTEHIPDLLIVCTLVYYLNIIFSTDYPEKPLKGVLCGFIGALGYFGKAFMFPFFISHFLLFNILHYIRIKENRKIVFRNAILGILSFFILSGVWIGILSNKYNKVTFDISGAYNHRIIGPEVKKISKYYGWEGWRNYVQMGHPVYDQGFFPPPNETAISIWEDFALLTPYLEPWSPLESWDSFKYQIKIIVKNIYYTIGIFEIYFSLFSGVIIIGYILLYVLPLSPLFVRDNRLYPLITMILFCGGYILVYPTVRYLWINNILILLMGAHLLNVFFQSNFFNNTRKNVLMFCFIMSFIALPLKDSIVGMQNYDKDFGVLTKKLEKYSILRGKKISSNDKFSETFKLAFYLNKNISYYGEAKENISDEELEKELKKYDIDYYLVWDEHMRNEDRRFLQNLREITNGEVPGLKIFSLKEQTLN